MTNVQKRVFLCCVSEKIITRMMVYKHQPKCGGLNGCYLVTITKKNHKKLHEKRMRHEYNAKRGKRHLLQVRNNTPLFVTEFNTESWILILTVR